MNLKSQIRSRIVRQIIGTLGFIGLIIFSAMHNFIIPTALFSFCAIIVLAELIRNIQDYTNYE